MSIYIGNDLEDRLEALEAPLGPCQVKQCKHRKCERNDDSSDQYVL